MTATSPPKLSTQSQRVLVVDDEESIRSAMVALLHREGHEVQQASGVAEAMGILRTSRFALLVTDLNMGEESGLDLTREARRLDPDIAVLMLTGVDDTGVAQQALSLGVFGYMIKPIQINEMRIAVMNALRRRELEISTRHQVLGLEDAVRERTAELAIRESRFRSLANSSPMGILYGDSAGICEYANAQAASIFGCSPEDLRGRGWFTRIHTDDRTRVREAIELAMRGELNRPLEHRVLHAGGQSTWVGLHAASVASDGSPSGGFVALFENIGPRKQLEDRMQHLATHDHLTGLANRRWLEARLEYVLSNLPSGSALGVAVIDLDQFKLVNDTYGHASGDELIVRVAERLQSLAGPNAEVARFGGDEFVVLLQHPNGADAVREDIRTLHAALGGRVSLRETDVYLGASIGLAITTDSLVSAAIMLRNADMAMHRAKDRGRGIIEEFDERLRAEVSRKLDLATELGEALESGGLALAYQPQFDARTGDLRGLEALARWTRADGEVVSPTEFIPIAEAAGLVHHVDRVVLQTACAQLATWQRENQLRRAVTMSVNVSARQLSDSSLVRTVEATIAKSGIDPAVLILEVTESVIMTDVVRSHRILDSLRRLGVKIAIDDFGTGYSSLSYLRELPVDYLKIDQSFIATLSPRSLRERDRDRGLVAAIIDLSHHFGLTVVAEGVEDDDQLRELRAMGCDLVQGFLFARPAPADHPELVRLLGDGGGQVRSHESSGALHQTLAPKRETELPPAATVDGRRIVVLIADDDVVQRTAYRRGLERAGAQVLEASSGLEALAVVAARHVDVALIDNHMPGRSGLEFLAEVRANPTTAGLPVVLATGTSYGQEIDRARQLGVNDWLLKPVELDQLVRLVLSACPNTTVTAP